MLQSPMTTIGPSIVISGELTSGEDITVLGRVSGQVQIRDADRAKTQFPPPCADLFDQHGRVERSDGRGCRRRKR